MFFDKFESRSAAGEWESKNGELRFDLEAARDRLRMMREERGTLLGRPGAAKRSPEADAHLEELKKENARLQKELEKMQEAIKDESEILNDEIQQRLRKPAEKKRKIDRLPFAFSLCQKRNRVSASVIRAAHAAQRSKRLAAPLTPLRCVRGSDNKWSIEHQFGKEGIPCAKSNGKSTTRVATRPGRPAGLVVPFAAFSFRLDAKRERRYYPLRFEGGR